MARPKSHNRQLKKARSCRKAVINKIKNEIKSERQLKIDYINNSWIIVI